MRGRRHERRDNAGAPRRAYGPLTRLSDAPRNLVWWAWTDPRHLAQWFGPEGFISSVPELDVRVGGSLRIVMRSGDDNDYPMKSEFREVVPPEQLVFSNIAVDNEDNHLLEGETSVNLKSKAIRPSSRCTLTPKVSFAPQMLAGMEAGWSHSCDTLAELVAQGDRVVTTLPKRSRPAIGQSPTTPRWSGGCAALLRDQWLPRCRAPALSRCG
jgi:uncharacterized protein YndB with AHSA1/START domain